ncbi:MAG: carboxypeptidase-like regulatory domain-containing protein [Nitrososphaeria archaeon]|nr:carboxypeptidase-like regulatory domain-containing protein [Nitrososphaeria archaeon]
MAKIRLKNLLYKKVISLIALSILILTLCTHFNVNALVVQLKIQAVDVRDVPLTNARISLFAPPPGAYLIAEAFTDSKGIASFTLTDPSNEINIFVTWKDVVVAQSRISSGAGFSKVICNVGFVKVRVMTLTNRIVSDSRVSLTWNTVSGPKSVSNFTGRDGFAVFASMPLQSYSLDVFWLDTSYKIFSETFTPKPETLHEVKVPLYEFILEVRDTSGKPVSNIEVVLENRLKTFKSYTQNGIASFKNLIADTYSLKVYYAGKIYRTFEINLESDKQFSLIVPELKSYTLTVQVVDEKGTPLPNSKVTVVDMENNIRGDSLTDKNGQTNFLLSEGVYKIYALYGTITSKSEIQLSSNMFHKMVISEKSNTPATTSPLIQPFDPIPIVIVLASILSAIAIFYIIIRRTLRT